MTRPLRPDMEELLHAAASWEPDAPPPADFAAFTRHALFRPKQAAPRLSSGLRAPLATCLACCACVLWVSSQNHIAPPEAADALVAAPTHSAGASALHLPEKVPAPFLAAASAAINPSVRPSRPVPVSARFLTSRTAARPRHKPRRFWVETTVFVKQAAAVMPPAPAPYEKNALWKTETVERPAWGALVPVPSTADCAASFVDEETGEQGEGEAASGSLPVVLDVTLPDSEGEALPPMPTSPTPSPTPEN